MQDIIISLGPSIWLLAKILALILLGIYLIFSFVVLRQVDIMTKTLELGFEGVIKVIAYLHLLFAIGVFFISFIVL